MNIGIPREIMTGEGRIALTPVGCAVLCEKGHCVFIESGAGIDSDYSDQDYLQAGVEVVATAELLYRHSQLIVKVKQPLAEDIACLQSHHILFCYLHLAADPSLTQALCEKNLSAIPFESVRSEQGSLPLLAPMSQVAGRIAAIRGTSLLFRNRGGRGVLLGGVDGSERGRAVVLGAGVAGSHAVTVLSSLGADVDVLDLDAEKLQQLKSQHPEIKTYLSTPEEVDALCTRADLVIGAVLLAGRRAPVVLPASVVRQMHDRSVIVDIAIDQGGCVEGIRATSSEEICYREHGVLHSAVPNMPATVARTSSQSLSAAILPYVIELAGCDLNQSNPDNPGCLSALLQAMAIHQGEIVDAVLQDEIDALSRETGS